MPKKSLFAAVAAAILFGFAFVACDTGGPSSGLVPDLPGPGPDLPGPGPDQPGPDQPDPDQPDPDQPDPDQPDPDQPDPDQPDPDQPDPGPDPVIVTNVLTIDSVGGTVLVDIADFESGVTQLDAGTVVTITVKPDSPTMVSSAITVTDAVSNTAAGILFANTERSFTLVMPAAANSTVGVAVTFEDHITVAVRRLTKELPAIVANDTTLAGKIETRLVIGLGKLNFSGIAELSAALDHAFASPETFDPGSEEEPFFTALRGIGAVMWHDEVPNQWLFHLADRDISPGLPFIFDDMMHAGVAAMATDVEKSSLLSDNQHPVNVAWDAYANVRDDTNRKAFVNALASFLAGFSEDFLDGAFANIAEQITGNGS